LLERILNGEDPAALGLEVTGQQQEQAPAATPTTQTPQQQQPEQGQGLILGRFKSPEELANSYTQLQELLGKQGNELGMLRQQLQQTPVPQAGQAPQAPQTPEAPKFPWEVEMTPAEKEAALEEYYANPLEAQAKRDQQTMKALEHRISQMVGKALEPLAPVTQKFQEDQQVQQFSNQIAEHTSIPGNEDFFDLEPQIQRIYEQFGDQIMQVPNAVAMIHMMARGLAAKETPPPTPPPTHEEILADPEFRKKILSDPALKQQIAQQYAQEIVNGGTPPVVIGSQAGGTPVAAATDKPRSVKDASAIFRRNLGF